MTANRYTRARMGGLANSVRSRAIPSGASCSAAAAAETIRCCLTREPPGLAST